MMRDASVKETIADSLESQFFIKRKGVILGLEA